MKLNLASGDLKLDGYVNVDLREDVADVVCDVSDLSQFEDESVEEIMALDILEHFPQSRTQEILAEWHRVLDFQGKLTLKVPNLFAIAKWIVDDYHTEMMIRNIYGGHRWGPDGAWDTHHTGWTPDLLHNELLKAGFHQMSNDNDTNMTVTAVKL